MRVLLVEDSATIVRQLKNACSEEGVSKAEHATNAQDAARLIAEHAFDIAVIDVMLLDGATGIAIARALRASQPSCRILLCSSDNYQMTAASMKAMYVQKGPGFIDRIRAIIRSAKKEAT